VTDSQIVDGAKHVDPKAEDQRTRVQFPPPPQIIKSHSRGFFYACVAAGIEAASAKRRGVSQKLKIVRGTIFLANDQTGCLGWDILK